MDRKEEEEHIDIGFIDVPKGYEKLTDENKSNICDLLIDRLLFVLDKELPVQIGRVSFLVSVLESSLITNEEQENYEICSVLRDTLKRINEA